MSRFDFQTAKPVSTRVDIPLPTPPNPDRFGTIKEYKPNLMDRIGDVFPDTGPTGVAKGVYRGMDAGLLGILPSGRYQGQTGETKTGEAIGVLADPFVVPKALKGFNLATNPIRKLMIERKAKQGYGTFNEGLIDKHFSSLQAGQGGQIPIRYGHSDDIGLRVAGSYHEYKPWQLRRHLAGAPNETAEHIMMNVPENWQKMPMMMRNPAGTLAHEKVHALQKHFGKKQHIPDYNLAAQTRGEQLFATPKTLIDFSKRPNWGHAMPEGRGTIMKENLKRFANPWERIKSLWKDSWHPESIGWLNKKGFTSKLANHIRYLRKPEEIEARIGSAWASGRAAGNRQLKQLQQAGFSDKQIEALMYDFDRAMNRIDKGQMYDNLFNSRRSLLQQNALNNKDPVTREATSTVINYFMDLEKQRRKLK